MDEGETVHRPKLRLEPMKMSQLSLIRVRTLLQLLSIVLGCFELGAAYPLSDNFESGIGAWTTNGGWSLSSSRYASPTHAITDSPGTFYANNSDVKLTLRDPLDLSGAVRPAMSFRHAFSLEQGYDFGLVEISTNGGSSWLPSLAEFSGEQAAMLREQVDLSPFRGFKDVRVRFRLVTDSSVVMDGWYVDDVSIGEAPGSVVLNPPVGLTPNHVPLSWTSSSDASFLAYRIYRSNDPEVDWHSAYLVGEIQDRAVTTFTDITVSPKTKYYYRLIVLNTAGLHSQSAAVAAVTPAGMDYPFLDNGEGGPATWVAAAPWGLSDESGANGFAWSDSPGTNYASGIVSQPLTLAAPMNLGAAVAPVLSFVHKYDFASGDAGYVEVSVNGGTDWTALGNFTGSSSGNWLRARMSLASYAGAPAVLVRFRLTTDPSGTADGWHVDDISVAESPSMIAAPVLDNVSSHSLRVTWAASSDLLFSHYAVLRSTVPDVGISSTLVATIPNQATTSFTDTGLALDTVYYYRVYAVSPFGTFSPGSPTESSARTLNNPPPFADGFEAGLINWNLTGTWNVATNGTHSGTYSLTDSPQGSYANSSDSYALTAVNLNGTSWPVLRFWDRVRMGIGDWGRVEVSSDGGNWTPVYGVSENQVRDAWAEQRIDLSQWRNQSNLRIRFHVWTDGAGTEDGWSIDDLSVGENTGAAIAYPFYEGFEGGLGKWLNGGWEVDTNNPYGGAGAVHDTVVTRMSPDVAMALTLAGPLSLTNAVNPQLTFWVRGKLTYRSYFRVQVSTDLGLNWADLGEGNLNYDWTSDWVRRQVSLQGYTNQTVRLRFVTWNIYGTAPDEDILLDKIAITEMPAAVVLETTTPHLKTMSLRWSASTLGTAFKRTEVYRATHAGVTIADTLVGTFNDAGVVSFEDSGLSIGTMYYYRVFTVDTNDTYTASNERSATTVPLNVPVNDGLENLDQWVTAGAWGITSLAAHSGSGALADSPVGDYANSSDSYALTAVNLNGTSWPVLRFWDRVRMGIGDWGRVEVSSDGGNWTPVYGVSENQVRDAWAEQRIDLSQWRNQSNLRIRFHVWTDGAGTEDGWSIDDLSVGENTGAAIAYPFYEGFEGGLGKWLNGGWEVDTNNPYGGAGAVHDTVVTRMSPDVAMALTLAGPLSLTNAVNPQLTFWVRGKLTYRSYFRVQVSTDLGLNWADLGEGNLNYDWTSDWVRRQVSLQGYTNQTVRLRFVTWNIWGTAPDEDIVLDKISVEETPAAVTLNPIGEATVSSLRLTWTPTTISNFKEYRVYRSDSPTVNEASELIAIVTNKLETAFTNTGLVSRKTYYYRVFVYNQNDTGTGSNQGSAMTQGVPQTWSDSFESTQPAWTFSGGWTNKAGVGRNGGAALIDSPGDYPNSADTWAQFGVDLSGATWPVLRFWDRHALADNDWGRLEVSPDAGGNWYPIYGVASTRTNWAEQTLDLSQWKGRSQVWIRFRMLTDGGTQNDGWYISDLSLAENPPLAIRYPFYEDFENGMTNWLHSTWTADTNSPFAGNYSAHDTIPVRMIPDATLAMTLAGTLTLTNTIDPQLTFWVRGKLTYRSYFRVQVSTDLGLNWNELGDVNLNYDWSSDWVKRQVSLAAYTNQTVRLRFVTWNIWGTAPDEDIFLDNIGIGDPSPGAPGIVSPAQLASVSVLRPTLEVGNAVDYQNDPLSYRFEVYSDAGLTALVAQVPAISAGRNTTAWPADVDLQNNRQYWWRCRASDGTNVGPWSETGTFFVNEVNHPPSAPIIAGPPDDAVLDNLDGWLFWLSSSDPDEGDAVVSYNLQVAATAGFEAPVIDQPGIPALTYPVDLSWAMAAQLKEFAGATNLVPGSTYYWRARAQDLRGLWSNWSEGPHTFQFGKAPEVGRITGLRTGENGTLVLEWLGTGAAVFVEYSPTLITPNWQTVAGPLTGTNWVVSPEPGATSGFYRLRAQ